MEIFTFVFLCLGLTIAGYAFHRGSLVLAGATAWGILGVYSYALTTWTWDIYQALFWLCIGMIFVSAVEGVTLNKGAEEAEEEFEHSQAIDEALREMDERIEDKQANRRGKRNVYARINKGDFPK